MPASRAALARSIPSRTWQSRTDERQPGRHLLPRPPAQFLRTVVIPDRHSAHCGPHPPTTTSATPDPAPTRPSCRASLGRLRSRRILRPGQPPGGPYVEPCIESFGPERCTFESNFPMDKMGTGYATLWNAFKRITAGTRRLRNSPSMAYGEAALSSRLRPEKSRTAVSPEFR
jgi:hypothetical protein